jgi:hypothetical protein
MRNRPVISLAFFITVLLAAGSIVAAAESSAGLANWFETVAEAERLARPAAKPPKPGADDKPKSKQPGPPQVSGTQKPNIVQELEGLIKKRNELVTHTKLFELIAQVNQGNPLSPRQQKTLRTALRDWFKLYFQMLDLQPGSRRDPNLVDVAEVYEQAARSRQDFVEGQILGAVCEAYRGDVEKAVQRLNRATDFLNHHALNVSPLGYSCCASWLVLGRPEMVSEFVGVLKGERKRPKREISAYQALLIGTHAWHLFRYNEAREYFEVALQKTDAWKGGACHAPGLVADVATFYLLAGSMPPRDPDRAGKLLEELAKAPPGQSAWPLRRARAAWNAVRATRQADAGDAVTAASLWADAVSELQECRADCPPVLDAEIDAQLQAYRSEKAWYRERPRDGE